MKILEQVLILKMNYYKIHEQRNLNNLYDEYNILQLKPFMKQTLLFELATKSSRELWFERELQTIREICLLKTLLRHKR